MRKITLLFVLVALSAGGWLIWRNGTLRDNLLRYVENGELITLEARYSPESLMEKHRKDLLISANHSFQEPVTRFYPYLLIEAKFSQDKKTREGMLLWGLCEGEMVLDTNSWDMTHGFADAIDTNATRSDFKVMHALSKYHGISSIDQLQKELHVEEDMLKPWLQSALEKHLIVQNGQEVSLHLENPKIPVNPQTHIKQAFVSKEYQHSECVSPKYSRAQVERVAQAAFGPTFTIRNVSAVYLPVYGITVLNPDSSTKVSYCNAINGRLIDKP